MRRAIIFIAICTICIVQGDEYHYKWTATVKKDQQHVLALVVVSYPQSTLVFLDEFVGGKNYTAGSSFTPKNNVDSAEIKAFYATNQTCPPPNSPKTLKFDHVKIRYIKSKKSYEKILTNIEMPLGCENATSKTLSLKDVKELEKADCFVNNKYIENEEEFTEDCDSVCHCMDGGFGCVDRCTPYQADWKKCQRVKEVSNCCTHAQCVDDMEKLKCDTTNVGPDFKPPWAVEIMTVDEKHAATPKTVCAGTIINSRWILTKSECVGTSHTTRIFHPISLSDSINVTDIILDHPENETRAHLALIKVTPKIKFSERIHEVNLPWPSECPKYANASCNYYTQSFNGVLNGEFQVMVSNRTSGGHCSLQNDKKPVVCLQMSSYPTCPNLEGSAVTVERSGGYYLTGFLLDISKKYENGCDINRNVYRPMISICKRLSWIHNVTIADHDD